jgi:hypothetical protein
MRIVAITISQHTFSSAYTAARTWRRTDDVAASWDFVKSIEPFNHLAIDRTEALLKVTGHVSSEGIECVLDVRSEIMVNLFILGMHTVEEIVYTCAHFFKTISVHFRRS